MNERILELAKQAGANYYSLGNRFEKFDEHKFAQLIVQECMNQVREQYQPVFEDKEMMMFPHWDGYVQCGVDSVVAIREHFFGVEE